MNVDYNAVNEDEENEIIEYNYIDINIDIDKEESKTIYLEIDNNYDWDKYGVSIHTDYKTEYRKNCPIVVKNKNENSVSISITNYGDYNYSFTVNKLNLRIKK